jgi:Gluconate 2-dehydrogenase subunit 3
MQRRSKTLIDDTVNRNDLPPELLDGPGRHTRRELLRYSAMATAATALPSFLAACGSGVKPAKAAALTSQEMATLRASLAQLLPQDALGPGALEAGVDVYIDRALADAYKVLLPTYQSLLAAFEKAARSAHGKSFPSLAAGDQVALLEQVEAGKAPGVAASDQATAATSFQLLLAHMREGMFADPMYGGNRNLAGWQLIGYPGVTIVWTAGDQAIGARVPRSNKTASSYGGAPFNGPDIN